MVQIPLNRHATPLPHHSPHPSVHPVPILVVPHRNLPLHSLGVNNRGHLKNWPPRFGNIPGGGCWCVRWYRGSVVGAGNATKAFTAVVVTVFLRVPWGCGTSHYSFRVPLIGCWPQCVRFQGLRSRKRVPGLLDTVQ